MISQSQNKSSKRWWIIFLFMPMLVSCWGIVPVLYEVILYVGGYVISTGGGIAIEKVVDQLVYNLFHRDERPGYIIVTPNNPLEGKYSQKMKFSSESSGKYKEYTIKQPRMFRKSINSPWKLAPDLQEIVEQVLKR
jgi:hypothetical protein